MYRVLLIIFWLFIFFARLMSANFRMLPRYRRSYYDFGYNWDSNENYASDFLRARIRRFRALRACKKFLVKGKNYYRLSNKSTILIYNTKTKIIKCYNNLNKKHIATVDWNAHETSQYGYIDNIFEESFDNICFSFNENVTFSNLVSYLKQNFEVEEEKPEVIEKKTQKKEDVPFIAEPLVDMNNASEEELAKLPGITVIVAKKIIKYRDLHKGFKSKENFYKEMNIKPHFRSRLEGRICVNEYRTKENNITNNERIIDL